MLANLVRRTRRPSRPTTPPRARLGVLTLEDRTVPSCSISFFFPYQDGTPRPVDHVSITGPISVNSATDTASATFVDQDGGAHTVALLVFSKLDPNTLVNDPQKQVLISFVTFSFSAGAPGATHQLTVGLPCGNWQIDAEVAPLGSPPNFVGPPTGWNSDRVIQGAVGSCDDCDGGIFTIGYWKNHAGDGPQPNAWTVSQLTLGSVTYTKQQLLDILNTPSGGNALLILAKQLIAAKLNIANGATASQSVLNAINAADGLIGSLVVGTANVQSSSALGQQMVALAGTLDTYNNSGP